MKKIFFLLLLILIWPQAGQATTYGSSVYQDNKFYINYFENWGYPAIATELTHDVVVLESVRHDMVNQNKINDHNVLIDSTVSLGNDDSQITLEKKENCNLDYGDEGGSARPIGSCYHIQTFSQNIRELTAMTLALEKLSGKIGSLNFAKADLVSEYQNQIDSYLSATQYYYPVWSPNNKYVAVTFWRNAAAGLELYSGSGQLVRELETPAGYFFTAPFWSADSKYLIYASMGEIKIFNAENFSTKTITLEQYFGSRMELTMNFLWDNSGLQFSADQDLYASYPVYVYNFQTNKIEKTEQLEAAPCCSRQVGGSEYLEKIGVLSPDGSKVAEIYKENGLRKFRITDFETEPVVPEIIAPQNTNSEIYLTYPQSFVVETEKIKVAVVIGVVWGIALILLIAIAYRLYKK